MKATRVAALKNTHPSTNHHPDDRNARPADERSANRHTLQYPIIEELIIARRYTEERPANLYGKLNLACRTPGA